MPTSVSMIWLAVLLPFLGFLANAALEVNLSVGPYASRFNYSFTPLINVETLVQYNDAVDAWSANVRLSWLTTASTGLFVVFNTTEGLGDLLVGPQTRSFIVKYTHQFDILR